MSFFSFAPLNVKLNVYTVLIFLFVCVCGCLFTVMCAHPYECSFLIGD